jgi:hypothetical protein
MIVFVLSKSTTIMEGIGMPKQSKVKTQDVVLMYTVRHLTTEEIGRIVGMTRQSVCKRLKVSGITAGMGTWVETECYYCGNAIKVRRKQWRVRNHVYCGNECYYASLENPNYHQSRQGQRIARAIVNQHFRLDHEMIVHHKDGDTRHNDLSNLSVYTNQSDHLKATHHHNLSIKPIWDGQNIS